MDECEDYSAYEKAAVVTWALAHGAKLKTSDVEDMTGLSRQGSYKLMQHLSRVLPACKIDGLWETDDNM